MNVEDLKRVQEINYELLSAVDHICKKHNIQYTLMFGALLGAVRHKGPIPWDDDIDIAMTRENYLRFFDVASRELDQEKYSITVMGSGSLKYVSEIKLGVKGTLYCMPGCENLKTMNSVCLDVFCFETAKKYSPRIFSFLTKITKILWLIKQNPDEKKLLKKCIDNGTSRKKFLYKMCINTTYLIRMIFGEVFFEWLVYKIFVDTTSSSNIFWERTSPHYFPKEWIEKTIELDFGPRKFPCPSGYDDLLKTHYGNYLELPPEGKRVRKYFDQWIFSEKV